MELPKNITQIGENKTRCKIYVEDYVFSYIKQLNPSATEKSKAIALYGVKKEEDEFTYLFLYGACLLDTLEKENRHLSQAVMQEIEKHRKMHFFEYDFLAYCILQGEWPEGFYVYEQGICRLVTGYARFYEKNDSMLAFMVEKHEKNTPSETVDDTKYQVVRKRQEELREARVQSQKPTESVQYRKMKWAMTAAFLALCVLGIYSIKGDKSSEDLQVALGKFWEAVTEQQIPDMMEAGGNQVVADFPDTPQVTSTPQPIMTPQPTMTPLPTMTPQPTEVPAPTQTPEPVPTQAPTQAPQEEPEKTSYTVKRGDTLLEISIREYGTKSKVSEICKLNGIDDPDDIKIGQKILLP